MDALVLHAGQREQDVRDLRREISDVVRHIQRLKGDLESLIRKVWITHTHEKLSEFSRTCRSCLIVSVFRKSP